MKYHGMSQNQISIPVASMSLVFGLQDWTTAGVKWQWMTVFTLALLITFLKYTLVVNNHIIIYTIQLFGLTVYKRELLPRDIKKINFKRTGWKSKLAKIKVKKGFTIRIALFKPEIVYDELIQFCEENTVPYEKSKDFKLLEKWY